MELVSWLGRVLTGRLSRALDWLPIVSFASSSSCFSGAQSVFLHSLVRCAHLSRRCWRLLRSAHSKARQSPPAFADMATPPAVKATPGFALAERSGLLSTPLRCSQGRLWLRASGFSGPDRWRSPAPPSLSRRTLLAGGLSAGGNVGVDQSTRFPFRASRLLPRWPCLKDAQLPACAVLLVYSSFQSTDYMFTSEICTY